MLSFVGIAYFQQNDQMNHLHIVLKYVKIAITNIYGSVVIN